MSLVNRTLALSSGRNLTGFSLKIKGGHKGTAEAHRIKTGA